MRWDDLNEGQRDAVMSAVADALGPGAYDCGRVWSAWSYGTMGEDDFAPVRDSAEWVTEIARAVVEALPAPAPHMVPWEPRDGWPTVEQVKAWEDRGGTWGSSHWGGIGYWSFDRRNGDIFANDSAQSGVALSQTNGDEPPRSVFPIFGGRPVSWAEVDAAVEAAKGPQ